MRLDQEVKEARRIQAEAVVRIQDAEQRVQHAMGEVLRLTGQQDPGLNPTTEEAPKVNAAFEAQPQQSPRPQSPQGNMSPGSQFTINPPPSIESHHPLGLPAQQEADVPTSPFESTRDGEILNASVPTPGHFANRRVLMPDHPNNMNDNEVQGIEIDVDGYDGTGDISQHPSSDDEVEVRI